MNVLIVEDETAAQNNLTAILRSISAETAVMGITESVAQTVRWLSNNPPPDIIFMDIHLSDGSAFNIFSAISVDIPIIFTTAYDEYAIDAFKVNSVDYLLKPIEEDHVRQALGKFHRLSNNDMQKYMSQIAQLINSGNYPATILLPVNDKLLPIGVNDISCFYSTQDQTSIFLKDGRSHPYGKTLEAASHSLDPRSFLRANRQYIIAKSSIRDITIWFDNRLLVTLDVETPEKIYVSKNKAMEFKEWMTRP